MISTIRIKLGGFTIVESIMSMAIVAAGTLALIASLKYGDNTALRARLDSRGGKEFAKQVQWIVSYPSEILRSRLPGRDSIWTYTETTKGGTNQLLIPQAGPFALRDSEPVGTNSSGFSYWTTLEAKVPAEVAPGESASPYEFKIATFWEVPAGPSGGTNGGMITNVMEIEGMSKW
jgi:hypothetical protein